tara:strand:+ start:2351 stop:2800 length:450 start_codon:yes stop_codon:yes gene_type:complete
MSKSDMQYCPECGINSTAGARVLRGEKGTMAATQNEMERVRAERDALQQQLNAALEREAALAAHVERCHEVMRWVEQGPDFVTAKCRRGLEMLRNRQPATDLTRRDLIKQADMVELVVRRLGGDMHGDVVTTLNNWVAQLKKEAQELTK